ncbi:MULTISPECIES: hypothetical protein [unclassified Pseudomonas]|uniref:hypothetical protein n=1 Tax=unclassified Pseudomonas TaxID=196821 RepID=UPI00117A8219|nr:MULTISPECIES: hypothetical protein [unclassified Pseudomonas]
MPLVLVPPQVCGKIQDRTVNSLIFPLQPQPDFGAAELAGISAGTLLADARLAFGQGRIPPPIPIGYAFEIRSVAVHGKYQKIGTGIVGKIGITGLQYITDSDLARAGYMTSQELRTFWHQVVGDEVESPNPWCWVIEFVFKG